MEGLTKNRGEGAQERLALLAGALAKTVADPKLDTHARKRELAAGKKEIDTLDVEIRKQFAETERMLKDARLPSEIQERHQKIVKHYNDSLTELKGRLERIDKGGNNSDTEMEIVKLREYLEKVTLSERHQRPQSNRPPPRLQKPVKPEPRLKQEDFEKAPKKDRDAWRNEKRIMVASAGPLTGLLAANTTTTTTTTTKDSPTSDDLAETIEVQFTPAIKAKALELGYDPLKIYEWVRNNIEYVPTFGSIQGADQCLETRQGNDFDTASLLVALLRVSGVQARFAYGTIELPIDKAMSWVGGMSDPVATVELLASSGIPVRAVSSGGAIQKVQLEHAWVEAWIDYLPSRGARHKAGQGDSWIPLDASFKQHRTSAGLDLASAAVPFDSQSFINQLTGSATVSEAEGYATNVRCAAVDQYQQSFRAGLQSFLNSEHPDATIGEILGSSDVVGQTFPYLLGTLPYHAIVKGGVYSDLPASLRHKVTFTLVNQDTNSANYSETTLSLHTDLPKLAGKRVTLSYSPASAADEAILAAYAPAAHADGTPLSLNEYPSSLPSYLIQVKAELRVNGVVVATGLGAQLGGQEDLTIAMSGPNLPGGSQELSLKAGEYLGIAFGSGPVTTQYLEQTKAALDDTRTRLKSRDLSGLTKDEILGSFLHASALASLAEIDALNNLRGGVMGVATVRRPSSAVVTQMLSTTYFFGIPIGVSVAGPSNAEMGYRLAIVSKDGNTDKARRFLIASGLDASASAGAVQEYLLTTPDGPVTSVSAVKAMRNASESAIPLYRLTAANSATQIGKLQLSDELKQQITNEAAAGYTLIAPRTNVAVGSWSGVGYEAIDAGFGNNYTDLNGPRNLVQGMPWVGRSILLNLWPTSAQPPQALASSVINDSFVAGFGGVVSGLVALPSQPASDSLGLLTTSLLYDRLGSQLGCYIDLKSPTGSTGACMATFLSLLCTASETPIIADKNHAPVADAGADQVVGIGASVTLDGGRSYDPDNDPLSYQWKLLALPEGSSAALAGATTAAPTFTAELSGTYTAQLIVSDGKKESLPTTVTVTAFPAVVGIPALTGLVAEDAKTLIRKSGLSVGAISAATDGAVEPGKVMSQSPAAGSNAARGSAVDVTVSTGTQPDTTPPVITADLDRSPALYAAGATVRVTASATDTVGISSLAMTVDGAAVSMTLPETRIATTGFAAGSSHTVTISAQDISLNTATKTLTFGILDPADTTAPDISILSPVSDAAVTAPVDVVGTVSDNNLFLYTLAYAPAGKTTFTVFASGNRQVTKGVLGRLDPSLMQNGVYDVVLTAVDANGNTATYATRYRVTGDLKVGNFTVSFTDLNIPLAGIPVTLTRSYDSRSKQSGDFGVGWNIDIQNVKIEPNTTLGEGWSQTSSGGDWPSYCVGSAGERYIAITLPNGKVDEFDLTLTPQCQSLAPILYPKLSYTPRPGTTSTLQARNVGQVYYSSSGVLFDLDTLVPYNPSQYLLTTSDGTVYELDQGFGVKSVRDTNGNVLSYGASGIIHSSGKSIAFSRDGKGRITRITDPSGKAINYSYDANGNLASVTDQGGNVTSYTYNATHCLVDVIDPLGRRAVRNEYDNTGRLTAHVDPQGKRIEYNHDIQGRQEIVKDRNGNQTVYLYDDNGRVLKKTDPLGKSTTFSYDSLGNKLSETDAIGNTTSWTYDGKKNVLSETKTIDGKAVTTRRTYNALGKVLTTTDPMGNVTTNTYDPKGNLLTTKDALGNISTNTYDANGNILTVTDPLGNSTRYEYDGYGNRTKQIGPTGAVTSYSYDSRGNKIAETDPRGKTTTYGYDSNGKLLKVADALNNTTTYEYDKAGNKVAETNPLGLVTRYTYDAANRLTETAYPDGTTTGASYDPEGNRATSTDRAGRVTTYSYNANKQLVQTVYPDQTSQGIGYDDVGRQTSTTDASGKISIKEYDPLGRVSKTTDPDKHSITFEYDLNGNQTKKTDANGHTTQYVYDANNRLTKTILPGGQSTVTIYDELGRKTGETDAAGVTTTFDYDEVGNLANVTDALGHVTSYEYDENSNRTAIVDANVHRTEFVFDELNRLSSKTMPNGGVERYTYDAAGRQASKTDAKGQKIDFAYDAGNRLLTKTYPDGSTAGFSYTATGKRASARNNSASITYAYDSRDRLTGTTINGKGIGYTYDPTGRLATLTGPAGTIRYAYSDSGRLTSVTDPEGRVTTYSYDNAGNRTGLSYPNGTSANYSYDSNNRLTQLTHSSGSTVIASFAYTLGAIGNRTRIDELNGISRAYSYDSLYRLTKEEVTDPSGVQTYTNDFTYDRVGNRLNKSFTISVDQPVVSTDYSYNAVDQLVTENGITYTYDLIGSLSSKADTNGTTTYTYDYDNRLVKVTTQTQTHTYSYDMDGNRIESNASTESIKYLVDTNRTLSQVLAEYKADGAVIASYTYANDLISIARGGGSYWYHFDGLGSTRTLTESSATVSDTYDYDAFGNLIAKDGSTANSYLFTGQQYDDSTGFYYLRARYYQQRNGRFIVTDSWFGDIYITSSFNKYIYAVNDPINYVDLTGMVPQLIRGILAHRHITTMFLLDHSGQSAKSNFYLSAISAFSPGYIDLVDTERKEYYEIKPNTQVKAGDEQLFRYGMMLGLHNMFGWNPGSSWPTVERTEPFLGDAKATITYSLFPAWKGLITYQINGDNDFNYDWHMLKKGAPSITTDIVATATVGALVRIFVPKIAGLAAANMSLLQSEIGLATTISPGL